MFRKVDKLIRIKILKIDSVWILRNSCVSNSSAVKLEELIF